MGPKSLCVSSKSVTSGYFQSQVASTKQRKCQSYFAYLSKNKNLFQSLSPKKGQLNLKALWFAPRWKLQWRRCIGMQLVSMREHCNARQRATKACHGIENASISAADLVLTNCWIDFSIVRVWMRSFNFSFILLVVFGFDEAFAMSFYWLFWGFAQACSVFFVWFL